MAITFKPLGNFFFIPWIAYTFINGYFGYRASRRSSKILKNLKEVKNGKKQNIK